LEFGAWERGRKHKLGGKKRGTVEICGGNVGLREFQVKGSNLVSSM